jgi:hypothetical protein
MTTEPLRPNLPEEEDTWTDLAEDLFGIDFAQTPQSGEFVSPEELLAEDDQTPLDSEEPKSPALTVEAGETVAVELPQEAEKPPLSEIEAEATEQEISSSIPDMPEVEGKGGEAPTSERDRSADNIGETEKEDTFWDTLNDWNWDESMTQVDKTDPRSSEPERSRIKRSSFERERPVSSHIVREEDDFSSVEDLHKEYIDDSDFGVGLTAEEDEPVSESEISDSSDEQTEQAEEPQSKPQKRRRRRRRPRSAKTDTGDVEAASPSDEKSELKEESSGGGESSDQDDAADATPRKRRSRRRSSRSRKKRSDSSSSEPDSQTPEPAGESDELGELIIGEDLETELDEDLIESEDLPSETEQPSKASPRDVPSWEEAISYLISPKPAAQADSKSKTSPASTATEDSSESSKTPSRQRRQR